MSSNTQSSSQIGSCGLLIWSAVSASSPRPIAASAVECIRRSPGRSSKHWPKAPRSPADSYGAEIKTRPSAFEEALDIVRRLLSGETVSASRRFRIAGASLALRPAEWVEVHIGASALPAIDRAARLADGWIASPGLTCEEARAQADFYRQRCAVYGREPGAIVLRRDIYVGESSNEAQAVLQQALSRGYRNLTVAKRGRSCRLYPPLCILGQPTPVNVVFGVTIHAGGNGGYAAGSIGGCPTQHEDGQVATTHQNVSEGTPLFA